MRISLVIAALIAQLRSASCAIRPRRSIHPSGSRNLLPLVDAEIDIILKDVTCISDLPDMTEFNARQDKLSVQGRAAVETAVKAIQRFTLQRE